MTKQEKIKVKRLLTILFNNLAMYQRIYDLHRNFIEYWLIKLLFPKRYYNLLIELHTEFTKEYKLKEFEQLLNELDLNEK